MTTTWGTPKCLQNIRSRKPPSNKPCSDKYCKKVSYALKSHCDHDNIPLDTPIFGLDTYENRYCYCCCWCFADDTPIEATPGKFVLIQDINDGDTILAAGTDLKWEPTKVKVRSGAMNRSIIPNLYLVKYRYEQEPEPRKIIVTADHLFMMNTSKTLKAVQHIIPGDKLTTKDGNPAEVLFVVIGEHETAVQSIEMEGEFDGTNLDGHLLNSNGIVTGDYATQIYYERRKLSDNAIYSFGKPDEEVYEVGEPKYVAQFSSRALDEFLGDEKAWPKGFMPKRKAVVNVPRNAASFLTPAQAKDIRDNAVFNSLTNFSPKLEILRLFKTNSAFHPHTICFLDWYNDEPNAYAWNQHGQKFILIAGGLARVGGMYVEGFSLILSVMQARLEGAKFVGEADYNGINEEMRTTWGQENLYMTIVEAGIEQIRHLFQNISNENAAGDPQGILNNPSIQCRLETYKNGRSLLPIPDCAKVPPDYLEVLRATGSVNHNQVTVFFDEPVEASTATIVGNYEISDNVKVTGAQVSTADNKQVILAVTGLQAGHNYVLTVTNLRSNSGGALDNLKNAALIRPH
ncbi:MAG: hypothetical protein F6K40_00575 [Okeania sp. SIO3I5]|uniref:Ig-like domain-containing protein n=1 Tax=Okeania sp. SIO3I5 TaxID=2607805 RepID=UPI0013B7CE93|nr:Ig-like domain-containing protein [Okeania sp. SIO3I5]NEQ34882.1 hypothetical protein [Okeania sp. SIO3I5]